MKDRELDAKIAELLFGWRKVERVGEEYVGRPPTDLGTHPVPRFSTTWEGAGRVVEELLRRGYDVALSARGEAGVEGDPAGNYHANVLPIDSIVADDNVFESGDSAARAVCLAALSTLARRRPGGSKRS